ncbi:FecR family protein [Pedobacter sp. UBA4863]|uniref:FecR family protein n=1 Tax=Pedobacter sp. UBA4863 TaxID=1947060 RepID=UPI0025D46F56|nr:FecR family protein [Pedobacter sp. UBA4863]
MYQPEQIVELLKKKISETLNEQENIALQKWISAKPENQKLMAQLMQHDLLLEDIRLYLALWNNSEASEREQRIFDLAIKKTMEPKLPIYTKLQRWLPYAAALFLIFTATLYLNRRNQKATPDLTIIKDVLPGGNKATLMLADGRTINLNSNQSGIIVGNDITYLDGSSVTNHNSSTIKKNITSETLVLKTPMGGNYHVVLPDGSKVWLNANSTLTYPSHFAATNRVVKLDGEAYFEVKRLNSSKKNIPFKVISNGQAINVLGTEFNVAAYSEEPQTKTTLINGSIEVLNLSSNKTNRIKPGQQAILYEQQLKVKEVDISQSIAWKNGQFSFDDKSFEQIMREMARWYNLTVQYKGNIPTDQFTGNAFKTDKLSTVLRFLESSNIQYHISAGLNGSHHRLIIDNSAERRSDN